VDLIETYQMPLFFFKEESNSGSVRNCRCRLSALTLFLGKFKSQISLDRLPIRDQVPFDRTNGMA
jgi:hypothetical protein